MVDIYRAAIIVFVDTTHAEVNSTSELANQRVRKALFTCVVYTYKEYCYGFVIYAIRQTNNGFSNRNIYQS